MSIRPHETHIEEIAIKIYIKTMIFLLLAIRCWNILCETWNRIRLTNLKDLLLAANVINVVFEQKLFAKLLLLFSFLGNLVTHDDVIKLALFPRYWPFVRGIHRSPVNSPHKCQWRTALVFSLICAWINAWVNHRGTGDLGRHRTHYDVIVMESAAHTFNWIAEKISYQNSDGLYMHIIFILF